MTWDGRWPGTTWRLRFKASPGKFEVLLHISALFALVRLFVSRAAVEVAIDLNLVLLLERGRELRGQPRVALRMYGLKEFL